MLSKHILGISGILLLFPLPIQAFPSDFQITQAAERICNTPRNSSESLSSIFTRSTGKWLYDQTISREEFLNEDTWKHLYNLVVYKAYENCPIRTYEIWNNYQFNAPDNNQ